MFVNSNDIGIRPELLVSVIVPCYNHQDYIEQCILSLVNQSYTNIELIVIDDGSSDRSPEIIRELSNRYGFLFIEQSNIGLSRTLNKAIASYAKGELIAVVASDDYWELNKIKLQVDYLQDNQQFIMVCGKAKIVDGDNNVVGSLGEGLNIANLSFENLLSDNQIVALTALFKKTIWEEFGGFNEESYIEDWDLWLKFASKYKIGFLNCYLGFYRKHTSNMSRNYSKMENAKTNILNQWKHHPSYEKVYKLHIRNKVNILSGNDKKEAFLTLLKNWKLLFDVRMLKPMIRVLVKW